ncbi:hypothetical protein [Bacillus benzoevorans]|uniref:Uncharacterized protein n=1 Tax=Bacillus benzoevorans TaxID=1456 RepID=A0A7X0HST7_9BACI|nr:hypothetical protein [Bacillus benzoevorans]MBB6446161.1 hypothetical protein [Bacillus benzoevorans]
MTNIIDGMDNARFRGGTVKPKEQKKGKKDKEMPLVLKNLKNGS